MVRSGIEIIISRNPHIILRKCCYSIKVGIGEIKGRRCNDVPLHAIPVLQQCSFKCRGVYVIANGPYVVIGDCCHVVERVARTGVRAVHSVPAQLTAGWLCWAYLREILTGPGAIGDCRGRRGEANRQVNEANA